MTEQQRYNDFQADIAALTLSDALAADAAGTLFSWLNSYWEWVKNPPPGGTHPPHKPPF